MTEFLTHFTQHKHEDRAKERERGGREYKMERVSSMFPLFSFPLFASDLHD